MKIIDKLETFSLFHGLSPQQLDELVLIIKDLTYQKSSTIFSEGDQGKGFYIVVSGQVKIFKLSPDGKEQILHIFGPGEPFAEAAVFAGDRFPAHATTLERSRIFFFPRDSFLNLIKKNPDLAMNMMAALSRRLKKFTSMIEALSLKEVPARLALHLLLLTNQQEDTAKIHLDLAKTQLAALLGTIPETLSRILSKMQKLGIIASQGQTITILDHQTLVALSTGERRL